MKYEVVDIVTGETLYFGPDEKHARSLMKGTRMILWGNDKPAGKRPKDDGSPVYIGAPTPRGPVGKAPELAVPVNPSEAQRKAADVYAEFAARFLAGAGA